MDRMIVWPGAIPLETDILNTNRQAMVSVGSLASALFGSTVTVNGLLAAPTAPASMQVQVGPGEIYSKQNVDSTAYSSLPSDTAHQTVKQGIQNTSILLNCPAPGSAGQSINYLIQAAFSEVDTNSTVLNYYNSSDPTTPYTGPNNTGASQPTTRADTVVLSAKAGTAATTGSQTTPAPDAGFVPLWVVTVAFGATTITSGNISQAPGAPAMPAAGLVGGVQGGGFQYAASTGTANALVASLSPPPASLTVGMEVIVKASATNTGAATLNLNGLGASSITFNGAALAAGVIKTGQLHALIWDGTNWQLKTPNADGIIAAVLTDPGYVIYSNGMIMQFGNGAHTDNTGGQTITFPIAFPNQVITAQASNTASAFPTAFHGTGAFSTTGMKVFSSTVSSGSITAAASGTAFRWLAIGK
jgi:hypothetical protein